MGENPWDEYFRRSLNWTIGLMGDMNVCQALDIDSETLKALREGRVDASPKVRERLELLVEDLRDHGLGSPPVPLPTPEPSLEDAPGTSSAEFESPPLSTRAPPVESPAPQEPLQKLQIPDAVAGDSRDSAAVQHSGQVNRSPEEAEQQKQALIRGHQPLEIHSPEDLEILRQLQSVKDKLDRIQNTERKSGFNKVVLDATIAKVEIGLIKRYPKISQNKGLIRDSVETELRIRRRQIRKSKEVTPSFWERVYLLLRLDRRIGEEEWLRRAVAGPDSGKSLASAPLWSEILHDWNDSSA